MHTFKILLALPVLTALASPMSENKGTCSLFLAVHFTGFR